MIFPRRLFHRGHDRRATGLTAGAIMAMLAPAPSAHAASATFTATADQPLRFGTIVTTSGGSRTIGADGSTSNTNIFPLGDRASGPAQFTLTYNRATGDRNIYQLIIQITLPTVPNITVSGIQGSLGSFTTDLAGAPVLQLGQTVTYIMPNCVSSSCSVTFHVGGTLNVTRSGGGGNLVFPVYLMTTVLTVLG